MSLHTESEVRAMVMPHTVVATDSFKPLPHGEVLTLVEGALNLAGLQIARDDSGQTRKCFTVVDKGAKMFATLPLTNRIDEFSQLQIGIANSWNKTLSLRIGFGSRVFVCSNGSFFAEKIIGRKHTANIIADLPGLMLKALEQSKTYLEQQTRFFARLRDVSITDREANDIIVRSAADHECITGGEIIDVVGEWRKPRYEDFAPRNAWSLHNAYTEVHKRVQNINGNLAAERSVRMSRMFADLFAKDIETPDDFAEVTISNN
jgi:hypothetical protein